MKRVVILAAMALTVSAVSASAATRHHHATASTVGLYDYAPVTAAVAAPVSAPMPLILGVAY